MILIKNLKFCQHIVLWKIHREKVLGDVLVRKQAFLDIQYKHGFKTKAKLAFLHDFGQKVKVFSSFVFIKNRSRKSVC